MSTVPLTLINIPMLLRNEKRFKEVQLNPLL